MSAEIALLDLRLRRRAAIGFTLGMAAYAFVIVAIYPAFENDTSLDKLTQNGSTLAALFGAVGPLTTSAGWLNANIYGNFLPLVVLLLTIGYGASAIAGQDEDGTLGLLSSLPVSRRRLVLEKLAAMCLLTLPVVTVTLLCVVAGRAFDLDLGATQVLGATVGVLLLGLVYGAVALLVGSATGSRGTALGVTSATAVTGYLVSSLAPVIGWVHPLRYASPFFYAVGDGQLVTGLDLTWALILAATFASLAAASLVAFDRLDVR